MLIISFFKQISEKINILFLKSVIAGGVVAESGHKSDFFSRTSNCFLQKNNVPPASVYKCGMRVFLTVFLLPKKSMTGNDSIETMQKIPISRDFVKAQEAIPHKSRGMYHT